MGIETALMAGSIASTVLGTGLQVMGSMQQANAQAQAYNYQAQIAENNRIVAQNNQQLALRSRTSAIQDRLAAENAAQDARDRGSIEASQQRLRTRLLLQQQEAALAGAGVSVAQDSAKDLARDTAAIGELDALTIRSNAEREALGFEQQARNFDIEAENQLTAAKNFGVDDTNLQTEAVLYRRSASNTRSQGSINAGANLVSGFGTVASKWYGFRKA